MDGRRAAPARQQRAVDVDAAQHRGIEEALRQDMAVGDDHRGIEIDRPEGLRLLVVPEAPRRMHGEAQRKGKLMHRRTSLLLAAPGRLGRPCVDSGHVMAGLGQRLERRHGEGRGTEKRNLHRRTL